MLFLLPIALACDASSLVTAHEGSRSCVYVDTTGHKTIGVGFNLDAGGARATCASLGIDYDSIYSGKTCLNDSQIQSLLEVTLRNAEGQAARDVSNYGSICCGVQNVVTDMVFNLGSLGGFHTLVSYFESENWSAAASDMRGTLWCRQVGNRCSDDAERVAQGCGGPSPPSPQSTLLA